MNGLFFAATILFASIGQHKAQEFPLSSKSQINLHGIRCQEVSYNGRKALRLTEDPSFSSEAGHVVRLGEPTDFMDGTIEVDVAGRPAKGAQNDVRGFVGIAFRLQDDEQTFECFNIRPTNGRADDQLRRNHATQYFSMPKFPWYRLREENPGVYESYADMESGAWTRIRIVVRGARAQLFVGRSSQPCLIVNDLKLGPSVHGQVALWFGFQSEAYFSNLRITKN